ncbi:MAG: hypothetical protein ABID54_04995 [Pseudomonadota bacterium]
MVGLKSQGAVAQTGIMRDLKKHPFLLQNIFFDPSKNLLKAFSETPRLWRVKHLKMHIFRFV